MRVIGGTGHCAGPFLFGQGCLRSEVADIGAHCAIASYCSAINPASVNFVVLQCEVVAYRLAACAEERWDYRRFVVSRLAPEES